MLKDILKSGNDALATPKQIAAMTADPGGSDETDQKSQGRPHILKLKPSSTGIKRKMSMLAWIGVKLERRKMSVSTRSPSIFYRYPQAKSVYLVSGTVDYW